MTEVRMPTQKRAIEKRSKIIEKGFELMCEKGFHNVTSIDIANYSGVSTGIIYQYFNDKYDIFIEGARDYAEVIMYPIVDILKEENLNDNVDNILNSILDKCVDRHKKYIKSHEELDAMSHQYEELEELLNNLDIETTNKVIEFLKDKGYDLSNYFEKIHIMLNVIDNYCHEIVYHKHREVHYDIMKKEIINIIKYILKESSN